MFACETARAARTVLMADYPSIQLFGDAREETGRLPYCDILVAGFPCQPFSAANRTRKGSSDARCTVVNAIIQYVQRMKPRAVVLENVPGILAWGQDVLRLIAQHFQSSGYHVDMMKLSSDRHGGVPQRRKPLYVLAIRSPTHALEWPRPMPACSLPSLLSDDHHDRSSRPTAPKAVQKLDRVERELAQLDVSEEERNYMVVNCHAESGRLFVGTTPCLTSARGAQGGFWLLGRNRTMTVDELLRLQGIDPSSTHIATVASARQAGFLLGNSFTLTVIARVLASVFRCLGTRVKEPVAHSSILQQAGLGVAAC